MIECIKTDNALPNTESSKYQNAVMLYASKETVVKPGVITTIPTGIIIRHSYGHHLEAFLTDLLSDTLTLINNNVVFGKNNFQSYNLMVRSKILTPVRVKRSEPLVDVVELHDSFPKLVILSPPVEETKFEETPVPVEKAPVSAPVEEAPAAKAPAPVEEAPAPAPALEEALVEEALVEEALVEETTSEETTSEENIQLDDATNNADTINNQTTEPIKTLKLRSRPRIISKKK